jgi:hypothetical protein
MILAQLLELIMFMLKKEYGNLEKSLFSRTKIVYRISSSSS